MLLVRLLHKRLTKTSLKKGEKGIPSTNNSQILVNTKRTMLDRPLVKIEETHTKNCQYGRWGQSHREDCWVQAGSHRSHSRLSRFHRQPRCGLWTQHVRRREPAVQGTASGLQWILLSSHSPPLTCACMSPHTPLLPQSATPVTTKSVKQILF